MESSLPESLTSTPLAPVAFVGLDIPNITKTSGRHTTIWHAFTAERSPDRVPLKVSYTHINISKRGLSPGPKKNINVGIGPNYLWANV